MDFIASRGWLASLLQVHPATAFGRVTKRFMDANDLLYVSYMASNMLRKAHLWTDAQESGLL